MEIYLTSFFISILFAKLASSYKNGKKKVLYTILAFFPFILVAAIRYDVGTDYMFRYVPDYIKIVNGKNIGNLEPLFKLIMKFCVLISTDYVWLFIITSLIMYSIFAIVMYKSSKNIFLSVIVFIIGTFYFQSLNLVRQFIAMAILMLSYSYLMKKKYIKWGLCICIAAGIHTISLLFFITFFLDKKVFKIGYLIVISILVLVIGFPLFKTVIIFLGNMESSNFHKYYAYLYMYSGKLNLSSFVPELCVYFYLYYCYYIEKCKKNNIDKEGIFFINMQFMSVICSLMNIYTSLFFRIKLIFSIFQIISISYFWNIHHKNEMKIRKSLINKNSFFGLFILVLLTTRMFYSNMIKGNEEVLPYKTIFERDSREYLADIKKLEE